MISNNLHNKKTKIIKFFKQKNFAEVIKTGSKLNKLIPNDEQLIYLLGLASINTQNFSLAEKYFEKLILIKKSADIHYTLGNIQKKLKKFNNAIISFENAIKINPNFSEAYNNLGNTKKLIGERNEAIKNYEKAINVKEDNIEALINLSIIFKENKNFKELIKIYERILALDENNIKTLYNLGSAYLFLGDFNKGRYYFERVINKDENHISSFRNYVSITNINKNNQIFKKLENIDLALLNYEDKILLLSALSKGNFDMKNIDLGFEYLNKSNLLKKEKSKFSIIEQETEFNNIKQSFGEMENLNIKFQDNFKSKPIFIVGMPRSGTSLIEQILSSHSDIHGAGELNFLQKSIKRLGPESPKDYKDFLTKIRRYYFENLSKLSESKMIIDKLPINFKWIGFVIKAFPEAKIIHTERNPMAVCWSNYKTNFVDSGMDFNLTQEDVAKYYKLYSDLMLFWKSKFGKSIFNVKYESFVEDFEKNTKKILEYLGLKWEKQMKNYQKNTRVVTTASYQQVREKIKKNTSQEWKKYGDYLGKMQETLISEKINF